MRAAVAIRKYDKEWAKLDETAAQLIQGLKDHGIAKVARRLPEAIFSEFMELDVPSPEFIQKIVKFQDHFCVTVEVTFQRNLV